MALDPLTTVKTGMAIFQVVVEIGTGARELWWTFRHDGKEKYGSVVLNDGMGGGMKIRVRWTGNRGHYLKVDSTANDAIKYLVSADGHRPDKYLQITEGQWELFLRLARGEESPDLTEAVRPVLAQIIREIEKHPEMNRVQG